MNIKFVSAFVSLTFVTSGCFLPTNALDGLLEYGPKHDWSDLRYEGIALKSDIPPNLSYLSSSRYKPNPSWKMTERGGSADARYLLYTPNNVDPPHDARRAEFLYLNSVELSDYSVLGSLSKLQEAWIVTENPKQLPQELLNALSTDPRLKSLIIRGDLSNLDLSIFKRNHALETLTLIDCKLTLGNIKQLRSIGSLKCLEISDSVELTADHVRGLAALKQLHDLRLNCKLSIDSDADLRYLPNLRRLEVPLGPSTDKISMLAMIEVLRIGGSNIDALIPEVAKLKNLKLLEIVQNGPRFTGETLGAFNDSNLKYLNLNSCEVTTKGFLALSKIKSLTGLDITWTHPHRDALLSLMDLTNLKLLRASCIERYEPLAEISKQMPLCTIQAQTNCSRY